MSYLSRKVATLVLALLTVLTFAPLAGAQVNAVKDGWLVMKVDATATARLTTELQAPVRARRTRDRAGLSRWPNRRAHPLSSGWDASRTN